MNKPVSVIGSGIGGLAVAIRLALKGYKVSVFEKNQEPGGKLSLIEKDGFRFDAGPSLFTQPENIEEIFSMAGEKIADYFNYESVDIACRYFFENGKIINAYTDPSHFGVEMERTAGESRAAISKYLKDSASAYHNIGKIFLEHSPHRSRTWLQKTTLNALKSLKPGYLFGSLDAYNRSRLRSPEAIQIFNRFATYNGSNPYMAPGMLSMIPHLEQNEGVFYPQGGMISIVNAMYRLAQKSGVQFYFNTTVESIITENDRVRGLTANGEKHYSPLVISNADVYFTWLNLLNNKTAAEKILKTERSSSALIYYWGMKKEFPQLHLHNIFFSNNYRDEFRHLFEIKKLFPDPTVYINITSKMEKGHAPDGMENWFVMINAPSQKKHNQEKDIDESRQRVISKLSRIMGTDPAPFIQTEQILTPEQIESSTGSYMGSLYGTSSNSKWAAFLRHPNFSKSIKGLYFVGGSVHPGGGIPLCLKSAKIVSELI